MKSIGWLLFGLSGLLPLLGMCQAAPDTTLLPYSVFVLAVFIQRRRGGPSASGAHPYRRLVLYVTLAGLFVEASAWAANYFAAAPEPALFHPQLIPDLLLGSGFYLGAGLALALAMRRWRFSPGQVFVLMGLYGVVVEQDGAVLQAVLNTLAVNPAQSLVLAVYVVLVYGSFAGLGHLPVAGALRTRVRRDSWLKYPVTVALLWLLTHLAFFALALLWDGLGLIPAARSITAFPLW